MIDIIRNLFKNKKSAKLTTEEAEKANAAATKFLEEQTSRKSKLPIYDGLERFELVEKIGDGAFSNVFKARDKETGKLVAIKVAQKRELNDKNNTHLHPSLKKRTKATERANILKEVQIMRGVNHNNIVKLVHFSESEDYYYLVLELCEGGELFHQIVKLTYFSEDLARHVIFQVAAGVRYLHEECGVVHRDIKPENILIDPIPIIPSKQKRNLFADEDKEDEGEFIHGRGGGGIGSVKLADFGLSKVIWDNSTKTPCGTAGYTAPEVVTDQRYSKSVDMWAIGCVLYTMLCGFPPFYDESIRSLTAKVVKGQYTFLSPWWDPISPAAKDLVSHLLCVNPDERYSIDEFFAHPWMQLYQGKKDTKLHHVKDPRMQAIQNSAVNAQRDAPAPTPAPVSPSHPFDPSHVDQEENTSDRDSVERSEMEDEIKSLPTPGGAGTTTTKRQDLFTPGFASLKEILDITYAVQRMGEESPQPNDSDATSWTEDEDQTDDNDDDDGYNHHQQQHITIEKSSTQTSHGSLPSTTTDGIPEELIAKAEQLALDGKGFAHAPTTTTTTTTTNASASKLNHISTPTSHRRKHMFKLNMDQATLLKNRRMADPSAPMA